MFVGEDLLANRRLQTTAHVLASQAEAIVVL